MTTLDKYCVICVGITLGLSSSVGSAFNNEPPFLRDKNSKNNAPTRDYPGRPPKQEQPVKQNDEPKFEGAGTC